MLDAAKKCFSSNFYNCIFEKIGLFSLSLICLFFFQSVECATNHKSNSTSQDKQLESLIHNTLPNANIGIILREAKTGKILYERQARELFTPASVTKLFTAAASLMALDPDYHFETSIKINKGDFRQETLSGNLYIHFSGDPSLTTANLKDLISQVKKTGIRQISGNIVIDDSVFQTPDYAMGWSWDSLYWYYAAPITGVILNENQIPIQLASDNLGAKVSTRCEVEECKWVNLNSEVIAVTEKEAETDCQIQVDMNQENALTLKGCWPQLPKPTTLKIALKNPYALAEKLILEALKTENIQFDGKIVLGSAPKNLNVIASHDSLPLAELLKKVLQDSNNIYSDSLTKTLGVKQYQKGTFQAGAQAIKEILAKPTGIDFSDLRMLDGSGLSRYNLITPLQISDLLLTMYRDNKNNKIFQEALATSGGSGTLTTRLNTNDLQGQIRAKTGGLLYVYNLAGYVTTKQDKELVFAIMINNVIEDKEKIYNLQSELCRLFTTF